MSKKVTDRACLLCLKDVDSDNIGKSNTRREVKVKEMCRLVQHPKFKGSIIHNNIISQQEEEGVCALCQPCADLTQDARGVAIQIVQLEIILKKAVDLIQARVRKSEEGEEGSNIEGSALSRLRSIRQSLLILSSDIQEEEGELKLEDDIKEEEFDEDDPFKEVFFDPSCSPSSGVLYPEEEDPLHIELENDCGEKLDSEMPSSGPHNSQEIIIDNRAGPDILNPSPPEKPRKAQIAQKKNKRKQILTTRPSQISENTNLPSSSNGNTESVNPPPVQCAISLNTPEHSKKPTQPRREPKPKYNCLVCGESFPYKWKLDCHAISKHKKEDTVYLCTLCEKKFKHDHDLKIHIVAQHETDDKPFSCTYAKCDERFTLKMNLERHLDLHNHIEQQKPHVCTVCSARFYTITKLEHHSLIHDPEKVTCEICLKKFHSLAALKVHIRIHTGEKPHKCDHCEEMFRELGAKKIHIAKIHSTPDQLHLCSFCGKYCLTAKYLKRHLARHEGTVPKMACTTCGEKFNDTAKVKAHRIKEHGDDPFICDDCGKTFVKLESLKIHKRVHHTGEKPYKCEVCDARFAAKYKLYSHMSCHIEGTPRTCDQCGKGFKTKIALTAHVKRVHSGERPIVVCKVCNKSFRLKAHLDLHMKKTHEKKTPIRGKNSQDPSELNLNYPRRLAALKKKPTK